MANPNNPNIKMIREAVMAPLSPVAVERLLREKAPPDSVEAPLTTTNSVVIHLTARVTFLEAKLQKVLAMLEGGEEAAPEAGATPAASGEEDSDEPVMVNTSRVTQGAVMPGPGGVVASEPSGPTRAPDATPFPAGVPTSAPPGTGQRVTVQPK